VGNWKKEEFKPPPFWVPGSAQREKNWALGNLGGGKFPGQVENWALGKFGQTPKKGEPESEPDLKNHPI